MLKFAMSTQFSVGCPTQKSVDHTCPQPNPKSQPIDGNTLKLQHGTCTANPAKLSHRFERNRLKFTGVVHRLGNLRSAKIGESFHLSLRLLSLHLQTLLEHLLLVYQLLTELSELPEHLSHLLGRHIAQSSESLNPPVSVSTHFQSRPQQRPPLASNQTTGVQHRGSATMMTQHERGSVS